MIKTIKSVRTNPKKRRVDNFLKESCMPINLIASSNGVFDGYGLKKTSYKTPTEVQIVKMFKAGGRIFSLCEDGSLYESKSSRVEFIGEVYNIDASILEIKVNGRSDILVARDVDVFTLNGYASFDEFPQTNAITYHNGRYYMADYYNVYITGLYNVSNSTSNFNIETKIWLDEKSGKILGFCPRLDGVIAVCEKAVYKIVLAEQVSNYKVQKINFDSVNAVDRTFAFDGETCVFINGGKLTKLVGDSLVEKASILDRISYKNAGIAKLDNGKYYYPITVTDKGKYLFVYDFASEKETLVSLKDDGFAWGEMVVQDGAIYTLNDAVLCNNQRNLIFNTMDFDDCDYKTLCGVSCFIDGDATLKIKSTESEKTYPLYSGYNSLVFNLSSRTFTFEISSDSKLSISDFAVKYRLKGE